MNFVMVSRQLNVVWQQLAIIMNPGESSDKPGYCQVFATLAFRSYESASVNLLFTGIVRDIKDFSNTFPNDKFWLNKISNNTIRGLGFDEKSGKVQLKCSADSRFSNDDLTADQDPIAYCFEPSSAKFKELPLGPVIQEMIVDGKMPLSFYTIGRRKSGNYIIRFTFILDCNPDNFSMLEKKTRFTIYGRRTMLKIIQHKIRGRIKDPSTQKLLEDKFNGLLGGLPDEAQTDIILINPPECEMRIAYGEDFISGILPTIKCPRISNNVDGQPDTEIFARLFTPRDSAYLIQTLIGLPKEQMTDGDTFSKLSALFG